MFKRHAFTILCILALIVCACFGAFAEEAAGAEATPSPTPTLGPLVTPAPDELEGLQFIIEGPDERMPMTITYGDMEDGQFKLEDLAVGTYTVREVKPDELLKDYDFQEKESITEITIEVTEDGESKATLVNSYAKPTPTVTPTPVPTPEPTPAPPEMTSVPVTKIWEDNNNADGNRPDSITVYLNANGAPYATAKMNAAGGWTHTFTDLPRTDAEGKEIIYTVSEAAVPMYETSINGYTIINTYVPETTTVSVKKIWDDDGNQAKMRPKSIYCMLSDGTVVVLDESNGWSATVSGLPTVKNGEPVTYTWTEQETLGYVQAGAVTEGNTTTFINRLRKRPTPPEETEVPPTRGTPYLIIEEYGTPLGVEVVINHVGDCYE